MKRLALFALPFCTAWLTAPPPETKAEVRFYLSTDCPVALKYSERINRLVEQFQPKGVDFQAVFPNEGETAYGTSAYMAETHHNFAFRLDPAGKLAKQDGIAIIPSILIRDTQGRIVYRGAIDDDPTGGKVKTAYAQKVLSALVANRPVPFKSQPATGCVLMPGPQAPSADQVNFSQHVAPIVYKHCAPCHSPGQVAPFSLRSYDEARKWSKNIAIAVETKAMPPWKAVDGYNEFIDPNRLTPAEIETLKNWADAGAPLGDPKRQPAPPPIPEGWQLGTPDFIASPDKPFQLEAEGRDVYRNFVIKTDFKESRWVTGMDVRPGNPRVVHHVIAFLDSGHNAEALEKKNNDGQPGYSTFGGVGFLPSGSLGGWAPGIAPYRTNGDLAFELKPGTTIVLQVHYHKNGKVEQDLTKVGLYFSKTPPKHVLNLAWIPNLGLRIPPNDPAYTAHQRFPIPVDVTVYGAMPHMHLLGKSMKAWVELPDKTIKPLVWVDDWDFNWQLQYRFKQPLKVPRGSTIHIEAVYDNSAKNKNQPNDPPQFVRWGEQTTDEMMLLILAFSVDTQNG